MTNGDDTGDHDNQSEPVEGEQRDATGTSSKDASGVTDPAAPIADAVDVADAATSAQPDDVPDVVDERADPGQTLFYEAGGSWLAVLVGPVLVLVVLILELTGPGRVHWPVLAIFFVILGGFGWVQRYAAQQHTSVLLTERTLRQGTVTIDLDDITKIYPANNSAEPKKWESAPALGELSGVPRRRKGIGLKLEDGRLQQAWARNDEVFRSELTQAWQAVKMGL